MIRTLTHKTPTLSATVVSGDVADMAPLATPKALTAPHNLPQAERLLENCPDGSRSKWGGIRRWQDAADLLLGTGWQEGADRARREVPTLGLADLAPEATTVRRRRAFRDAGDELRVDAALAGQWERAFETRRKMATRTPSVLSIGCAFGGNIATSHDEIFWCGVQMAAIADLLEGAGWRVELRAVKLNVWPSKSRECQVMQDWRVKQADQPLRWDTTLALLGHAGVYRTFGWWGNTLAADVVPAGGGHVQTGENFTRRVKVLADAGVTAPLSLLLPPAYSRDECIRNLRAALAAVRDGSASAAA